MLVQLMPPGRQLLIDSVNTLVKPKLATYEIGDAFNYTPDPSQSTALPVPNFIGTNTDIYKTIVTPHEMIFTVYLPYYLDLIVGNIILKTTDNKPLLLMVMDKKFKKGSLNQEKHFAGDTYYQSMILRFPNITTRLDHSNIKNFYSSARVDDDVWKLPPAVSIEEDQFVLQGSDHLSLNSGRMIYGTQVFNKQWACPLMVNIDDENIDRISGGRVGDGYKYDK